MFGCLLFKKFKKFNESCSLSKAARMSSTYLKHDFCSDFLLYDVIDFVRMWKSIAAEIVIHSTKKVIFTDKRLQLTYIHS